MGYMHIDNLYKDVKILTMFREVYCLSKIHGTSSHVGWNCEEKKVYFFSGGSNYNEFIKLFDEDKLKAQFLEEFPDKNVVIYGEAYGGKMQGMSKTYGPNLKFVAFDVQITRVVNGEKEQSYFVDVPIAEKIALRYGLDFVHYWRVPATLEELDKCRDADSQQAIKNGQGPGHIEEGIVIRPIEEVYIKGHRLIAKHKRDEFRETKSPRTVDPEKIKLIADANAIAEEWVTPMRLEHVLDKLPQDINVEGTKKVIDAMMEDVEREGMGEIEWSDQAKKAVGTKTAKMFKEFLQNNMRKTVDEH